MDSASKDTPETDIDMLDKEEMDILSVSSYNKSKSSVNPVISIEEMLANEISKLSGKLTVISLKLKPELLLAEGENVNVGVTEISISERELVKDISGRSIAKLDIPVTGTVIVSVKLLKSISSMLIDSSIIEDIEL